MSWPVVAAVLLAALTHAGWNAIAHGIRDQLLAFSLIGVADVGCGLVVVLLSPLPAAGCWPYLGASVALHVGYQVLLMRSFRLGEFGQMYPVARGTAPLVVTVLAAVLVGELPDAWQLTGILLACTGLLGVALWGIRSAHRRPSGPALTAALCTGLAIASYTVVDGLGVRASGTAAGYTGWLVFLMGPFIPGYALAVRRGRLLAGLRPVAGRGLLGGAMSTLAYGLVLWAQTRAPLAPVAALRESSIIAGAAIGALCFRERFGGARVLASVLMVGGIALMLRGG